MNFQTMNKQRKFILIAAVIGVISMFLPWISVSMLGESETVSGMHGKGILVFLCFAVAGAISYLGDQTTNLDKTMWGITLLAGIVALLFMIWFYSEASGSFMGSSFIGFGFYISALASVGILLSAYLFRSPADNIKDSFNTIKKDIESKINTPSNTNVPKDTSTPPGNTNPPV
jgi:hypothetical protein